ncbi:hypothetical protein [Ruegeria profundi]|uniref:Uncharacterized protein n=1 Tax=Ruegeria profundi TaxID=1685378 RepID=A0A0X3TWA2_9RHOB|nr:hypothetical protein [Ruegeria profundi]KUJ79952.1 hypothetical protein AVO44_07205 [Ruegeria profundi]
MELMVKLGSFIAWALIALGGLRTAMGFYVAFAFTAEQNTAAAKRYLARASSGEAINDGMIMLVVGVALGLLTKIAKNKAE